MSANQSELFAPSNIEEKIMDATVKSGSHFFNDSNTLQLIFALNETLDCGVILQHFFNSLMTYVQAKGLHYFHQEAKIEIKLGNNTDYSYTCHLKLNQHHLGEIILYREMPFTERDTLLIEEHLCLLLNPLKNAHTHLKALTSARQDPLTQLGNRAALEKVLFREIELAKRQNATLSVLLLDLDYFKNINDTYGHQAGDSVLKNFAERLKSAVRDSDMIFRTGGEEFIALLSGTDTSGAVKLGDRIRKSIESPHFIYGQHSFEVNVSIGVATYVSGDSANTLIEKADLALYRAKREGRNQVSI